MDRAMPPSHSSSTAQEHHSDHPSPLRPARTISSEQFTQDPAPSTLHSSLAIQDPTQELSAPPPHDHVDCLKSEPSVTITKQRSSLTPLPLKISQNSAIPSPTATKPSSPRQASPRQSPRRVKGSTGDHAFDSVKAVASRHALLERATLARAREESTRFGVAMADPSNSPSLDMSASARNNSHTIRSASLEPAASISSSPSLTSPAFPCEEPETVDISALISAAGSTENAIRNLLREKYQAAQKNNKLWRLLEKQNAMMVELNRDLNKIAKERDRFKKKLRDQLVSTASGSSLPAHANYNTLHNRDASESTTVTTPVDGTITPDSAVGSLTSERFLDDYLTQTPPSSAGHPVPSPNSAISPMYSKPMPAPFADRSDSSTPPARYSPTDLSASKDGIGSNSVTPRPKQGSFSATVQERSSSTAARKPPPARLDLSPKKNPYAPSNAADFTGSPLDSAKNKLMTKSHDSDGASSPLDLGGVKIGKQVATTGIDESEGADDELGGISSGYSSGDDFGSPKVAQIQTYQSLNALNTFVKSPHGEPDALRPSPKHTTGLPVSPRPSDRPANAAPPRSARTPAFNADEKLQTVRYDKTVPAEAPIMGPPVTPLAVPPLQPPPPPPVVAELPAEDVSSPTHPVISRPTNGSIIHDASSWGNRKEPNVLTKDRPKRSDSENKGREPRDRKRSIFGFTGRSSMEGASRDAATTTASPKPRPVFGMPLAEVIEYAAPTDVPVKLPAVVYRCLEYLRGMDARSEEGIFRMSGSTVVIKALRERFDNEGDVILLGPEQPFHDVHAVASLLKLYLRELPTGILTSDLHIDFVRCVDLEDRRDVVDALNVMVNRLPAANRELLDKMTGYLREVVDSERLNKMNVRNVGIVFSPTLNIPGKLITAFVTEHARIFGPPVEVASVGGSVRDLLSKSQPQKSRIASPKLGEEDVQSYPRLDTTNFQGTQFPEPPMTARFPPSQYYSSQQSSPRSPGTVSSPTMATAATFSQSAASSPAKSGRTSIFRKKSSIINLNDINISFSPLMGGTSPELTRQAFGTHPASNLVSSMSADQIKSPGASMPPAIMTSQSGPVGPIPSTKYSDMQPPTSPNLTTTTGGAGSKCRSPSAQSGSSTSDSGSSFGRRLLRRQSGAFLVRAGLMDDSKRAGKVVPVPVPPVDAGKGFVPGGLGVTVPSGRGGGGG